MEFSSKPIPREEDPVNWMLQNPHLGSFEAVLDAKAFAKDYGILSNMLGGLIDSPQKLKISIEIKAGRGDELPKMLVSHLAEFLKGVEEDEIYKASVRQVTDGKKQIRPTHLLNALTTKRVAVASDQLLRPHLVEFTIETIEMIGDALRGGT